MITINHQDSNDLQQLLQEFAPLFETLKGLPSNKPQDHKIPLKDESMIVKVRPYKHVAIQKDALENMIKEILENGIIRNSNNLFATPIVMVEKKVGT